MTGSSRWTQMGLARLRATCDGGKTHLTQVSHQAPLRLVPIPSSSTRKAGAAVCALSSYGGGMLPGDSHAIKVQVDAGARLGLLTQGPSRIYKGKDDKMCRSTLEAHVDTDGLLVLAPDPCVPFATSSFSQSFKVNVEEGASAIIVDWFGAGRLSRGEQWDFDWLSSRTVLCKSGRQAPFLVESTSLDRSQHLSSHNPFGLNEWNAFCSVILHGEKAEPVAHRLRDLSLQLASMFTRIRHDNDTGKNVNLPEVESLLLSGRVLLGISKIVQENDADDNNGPTFVARLAATCNEDMYRVLYSSLLPLAPQFGTEFYRDRLHASQSHVVAHSPTVNNSKQKTREENYEESSFFGNMSWSAYILTDSAFPTGGFAHSAGIEAAVQLKLFQDEDGLCDYIHSAIRSSMQLQVPFVMSAVTVAGVKEWIKLDKELHTIMIANTVGCQASMEQGEGLLRVVRSWRKNDKSSRELLDRIQTQVLADKAHGHLAPIFGVVCALLGFSADDSCRLLGYCVARDLVSAAVRLNLVGPLAGVSLLDGCSRVVQEGIRTAQDIRMRADDHDLDVGTTHASTCAPIVETVHPCHEILSVRLFRS